MLPWKAIRPSWLTRVAAPATDSSRYSPSQRIGPENDLNATRRPGSTEANSRPTTAFRGPNANVTSIREPARSSPSVSWRMGTPAHSAWSDGWIRYRKTTSGG